LAVCVIVSMMHRHTNIKYYQILFWFNTDYLNLQA